MVPLALGLSDGDALVAGLDDVGAALGSSEPPQPTKSTTAPHAASSPVLRAIIPVFMIGPLLGERSPVR
jgi:hypothetical protein